MVAIRLCDVIYKDFNHLFSLFPLFLLKRFGMENWLFNQFYFMLAEFLIPPAINSPCLNYLLLVREKKKEREIKREREREREREEEERKRYIR